MKINKELDKEIRKIHKSIEKDISKRLKEFKKVWKDGTEEEIEAKKEKLRKRMEDVKEQFDLRGLEAKPSGELPGGFKQRLSMAVALLHEPKILFLDEPTSGIDPLARRSFWRQITALAAGGTTIIITTHFMEEAEYCDRIMIQDQGKMLILGTPQEVREKAGKDIKTMNQAFIEIIGESRSPH